MPWFKSDSGTNARFNRYSAGTVHRRERELLALESYGSSAWDMELKQADYFVLDIETSGFSPQTDIVLSLAAAHVTFTATPPITSMNYEIVGHADTAGVPGEIWDLTGLVPDDLRDKREWRDILYETLQSASNRVWIAHHARHELSFLQRHTREFWRLRLSPVVIDTALVAQALLGLETAPTLDDVCKWLEVPMLQRHRADEDVRMTTLVWEKEVTLCEAMGLSTVGDVVEWTLARAPGS